jgi:aryl-alcohol dehydrogenase-like predicted oxidoreductase
MDYVKLGRTGLDVSRICLGCMSYGGGNRGNHAWSLSEEESKPFIKKALEAGINFFDTANRYSLGNSEEILGRAIRAFARRDEVVITTKVYGRMRPGPNGAGLSPQGDLCRDRRQPRPPRRGSRRSGGLRSRLVAINSSRT